MAKDKGIRAMTNNEKSGKDLTALDISPLLFSKTETLNKAPVTLDILLLKVC